MVMRKIRIAFFADVLQEDFDGVSNTLHQIARRLPAEMIEPLFISPHPPLDPHFPFKVIQCPYMPFPLHDEYRLALPWKLDLKTLMLDFKPDIIHWTSPSLLGEYAIRYARKNNIRISTIYHTHFPTYLEYYIRWLPKANITLEPVMKLFYRMYKRTDLILAPTKTISGFLVRKKIPLENIVQWGRGVDATHFHPNKRDSGFKKQLGIENRTGVLFVSRLVKEKETRTLLKFYELMIRHKKDWALIVVGDGPERKYLESNMPAAIFLGKKTRDELPEIYASSDVFLFPSVTETFGNVVLEAFASGIPVVVADAGGPTDFVKHQVTGMIAEPKNSEDMLRKASELVDNHTLRLNIIAEARKYAVSQNWEDLVKNLVTHYQRLAQQVKSP